MRHRVNEADLEFIEAESTDEEPWDHSDDLFMPEKKAPLPSSGIHAGEKQGPPTGRDGCGHADSDLGIAGPETDAPNDVSNLDDLFWSVDSEPSSEAEPEVSWEEFALLEDDTEEDDQEDAPVEARLSQDERALQVAAEIAVDAGWTRDEALLLAEVLAFHSVHGKTRGALRALTCEWRVTPAELRLLFDLRAAWRGAGFNRTYWAAMARDGRPNLSWQQALRVVRELRYESAEEIMLFVDDCFEDWAFTPSLIAAYSNFAGYLDGVIQHMATIGRGDQHLMPPFVEYALFADEKDQLEPGSPEWCDLFNFGLTSNNGLGREKYP